MIIKPASTKTFQKFGKWVEKPLRTEISVCVCGYKYVKTRKNQTTCIKCMLKAEQQSK
jgi:hypothetical protein